MKFLILNLLLLLNWVARSQDDLQFSVMTDEGVITVSKSFDGKDMMRINVSTWDKFCRGTQFSSHHLQTGIQRRIFILIASRYSENCNEGIGICMIADQFNSLIGEGCDSARIVEVLFEKIDPYTVRLIFLTDVNWQLLQDDHTSVNCEKETS
jgi:hypothetical protein